jgi:hypothetical protein
VPGSAGRLSGGSGEEWKREGCSRSQCLSSSFFSFWCVLVRHLLIYSKHLSPTNVVVRYRKNKSSKFESEAEESEEVSAVEDEEEKMLGNDD